MAMTVAGGEVYAGLQHSDFIVYWRQHDKRLALIEPNTAIRSSGDQESQDSVKRLFTDRLLLDVPIVAMGPHGGPVIDATALLVGQHIATVVRALGHEPRAPFPRGHALEQGEWSLLDAVRDRPRMWRDVDGSGR